MWSDGLQYGTVKDEKIVKFECKKTSRSQIDVTRSPKSNIINQLRIFLLEQKKLNVLLTFYLIE